MATATVRDLRNHFPKIKEIVETEAEVIVKEKGQPKYKLTLYTAAQPRKPRRPKDYMSRLQQYQPRQVVEDCVHRVFPCNLECLPSN
jgi:antitoxin (DNA-binding transcriptional repressor) of toxin-antitoxin stability system